MIIECVGQPFTYRWPGGEVHLEPGKPVELPDDRAKRLLARAPGKVRVISGPIQPGKTIAWARADGTVMGGIVDLIHHEADGQTWAFVTLPGGAWAAVNVKFVRLKEAEPTR